MTAPRSLDASLPRPELDIHAGHVLWVSAFPFRVVRTLDHSGVTHNGRPLVWVRGDVLPGYGLPGQEVTLLVTVDQPFAQTVPAPMVLDRLPDRRVVDGQAYQRMRV